MVEDLKQPKMNKFRATFWPIYKFELKKFLPMCIMMICILFVYTLCRDLKDTLIQTRAVDASTEILSPLKLFGVLPFSVLFTIIFMKLSNKFSNAQMFYGTISFFIIFFLIFGFVLYPLSNDLHASLETLNALRAKTPKFFYWVWPAFTNWTFSLAYIFAELWGTAVLSMLFWQFANETTKTTEAPRFYSFYGMLGNLGLIASGKIVKYFSSSAAKKTDVDVFYSFGVNLKWQMFFVAIAGIILLYTYHWMQKHVLTDSRLYTPGGGIKKKAKPKMGVGESLKYIIKNPYIMLIALLVITYGMSITLDEQIWKSQAKVYYKDANEYNNFTGGVSERTGILTMILMIIGTNILRSCKWKTAALATPIFLTLTSVVFFSLLLYKGKVGDDPQINWLVVKGSLLYATVWVGMYQVATSKGIKYSLFDSTKNMAYMPLDPETKLKSQAAVEIIGGRLGKSGGSFIIFLLTSVIFHGAKLVDITIMKIIMVFVFIILAIWIVAVFMINPKVVAKLAEKRQEEKEAKELADKQHE